MKIKASRIIQDEAEIATPSWFKKGITYYFITDKAMLTVTDNLVSRWDNLTYSSVFQEKALEASTGEPITKEDFDAAFDKAYASFIDMFTDNISLKISA